MSREVNTRHVAFLHQLHPAWILHPLLDSWHLLFQPLASNNCGLQGKLKINPTLRQLSESFLIIVAIKLPRRCTLIPSHLPSQNHSHWQSCWWASPSPWSCQCPAPWRPPEPPWCWSPGPSLLHHAAQQHCHLLGTRRCGHGSECPNSRVDIE